jgi:hypothetical protein
VLRAECFGFLEVLPGISQWLPKLTVNLGEKQRRQRRPKNLKTITAVLGRVPEDLVNRPNSMFSAIHLPLHDNHQPELLPSRPAALTGQLRHFFFLVTPMLRFHLAIHQSLLPQLGA